MNHPLFPVFHPESIAVIGASEVPGKAAERRIRSLIKGGYKGDIFLINPKRDILFGRKAYPSVLDVGKKVDLAMIVVAPRFVPQAVADSVKMGARGIVIITAGLGESGEEGKMIEREILKIASDGGAKIIGPNCSGLFSASACMNLLGIPPVAKGPMAVIAQSGNIIDSVTHYAAIKGIGLSSIISAGNAIGVKFHEYLEYLAGDEETKVVMMYMEGINDGDKLVAVAREVSKKKPIVVLKVGRSNAGARAAASHTGSLAVDDSIVEAAFKQAGIVRVYNVDEMFDAAICFAHMPLPKGNRVAIISEGGGDNSVAADNAEINGLEVPVLPQSTQEKIKPFLLAGMPAGNPIDYGGTAEENPDMINKIAAVLMEEDIIDSIYITGFFGGFKEIIAPHVGELEEKTSLELVKLIKRYKKPIAVHTSFANEPYESIKILTENGVLVTPSSLRAARCLSFLSGFAVKREKLTASSIVKPFEVNRDKTDEIIKGAAAAGRTSLLETEAREVLKHYGIRIPLAVMAKTADDAVAAAKNIASPVALKIVSPAIIHKSDAGGIRLNLKSPGEIKDAFGEIIANAGKVAAVSDILGVLVSPMAPAGQECIIGMVRTPQFGPAIMFGLGGVFVEVLKDVSFRVIPTTVQDIDDMIKEIKGYPLLTGIRGYGHRNVDTIKDILARVSQIAADHPDIKEIDINPLIVHEDGASVVDARIIIT